MIWQIAVLVIVGMVAVGTAMSIVGGLYRFFKDRLAKKPKADPPPPTFDPPNEAW